jgi:GAG-pre-integrase domain
MYEQERTNTIHIVQNNIDSNTYNQHSDIVDINIDTNEPDDNVNDKMNPTDELLICQNRLAHIPMKRIQKLAQNGILPKSFAQCNVPLCPACLYGKMTRKLWRNKQEFKHISPINLKPGQFVSVDQITSNTPGL